jgi:hypothetical protein
MPSLF